MLALMLDSHPDIAWAGEMQYLVDYLPGTGEPDVAKVHEQLRLDRGFRLRALEIDPNLSFSDLARSLLMQRTCPEARIVGATVHLDFDRLVDIWPNARFIHLVRDPRDVSRSVMGMGWAGNAWVAAETWLQAEKTWEKFRGRLSGDRYFDIRFEALVRDPAPSLTELCAFLGVPFCSEMLTYPERTTYSLPDPSIAEAWKARASGTEVRLIESRCERMLQKRGYRLSTSPTMRIGKPRALWLRMQSRFRKIGFRIHAFGLTHVVAEFAARRFGAKRLHRRLVLRQHDVTNAGLK